MRKSPQSTEAAYERYKGAALLLLRRRCPWLAADEREAAYHDAFAILLEKHRDGSLDVDAMHELQVRKYLMTAVVHRGLRVAGSAEFQRTEPAEDPGAALADPGRPVDELVALRGEAAAIREVVEELPERRRAIIKLRFWLDRNPREIQAFLRISERAYRKDLERAFQQLAERLPLVTDGGWCEERRSLVLAYVAGIAGPARATRAREHLEGCPACRRMAAELRALAERAAAVAPMPGFVLGGGPLHRLAEALVHTKQQASEVTAHAKAHTANLVSRADASAPGYGAGARPGAAVAVVAGCLAVGGGATYCAVDGLPDPLRAIAQSEPQIRDTQSGSPEGPVKDEIPVDVEPTPQAEPPPETSAPAAPAEPPPESAPTPPPPPPEPAREFAPDAAAAPAPSQPPPSAPPTTPAQAGGPGGAGAGEFSP